MKRHPLHQAAFEAAIEKLRAALLTCPQCGGPTQLDRGFHNAHDVAEYLAGFGVTNGQGRLVTYNTVRNWADRRGFPSFTPKRSKGMFVTSFQILAWLWSFKEWHRNRAYRSPKLRPIA